MFTGVFRHGGCDLRCDQAVTSRLPAITLCSGFFLPISRSVSSRIVLIFLADLHLLPPSISGCSMS